MTQASQVRAPRSIVQVNGQSMPFLSWEIDSNSNFQADTFRLSIPVSSLPDNFGMGWWSAQDVLQVEIFVGFPSDPAGFGVADLQSLFFGRVDDLSWDLPRGLLELSGRDLTALLIDTKTDAKFVTKKSSEVATLLATKYGLTPVVTATKIAIGKFVAIDHVRLQDQSSEWDLLTWLAHEEGFNLFVRGQELHFEPKPSGASPYVLTWTPPAADGGPPRFDGTSIVVSHNYTLAKDIRVTVVSWNMKGQRVKAIAEAPRIRNRVTRNAGKPVTPAQEYTYTIAGLDHEGAQRRANQILADLSRHEMRLAVEGPADAALTINDALELSGTGTAFDQTFFPDSITRSFGVDDGFRWHIEAKNHSPESVPTV